MSARNESKSNRLESTNCSQCIADTCDLHGKYGYPHPVMRSNVSECSSQEKGSVIFLWDIEKVPIPKERNVCDMIQRIRQKFVIEQGLQEAEFSCYCNTSTLSEEDRNNLDRVTVRMIHVPNRIPGAIDRKIILELDRMECQYRPPTTVVIISDGISYLDKIDDLRHNARFRVIVIQTKSTNRQLEAIVDEHYFWASFTEPSSQALPPPIVGNSRGRPTNPFTDSRSALPDRENNSQNDIIPASQRYAGSVVRSRRPSSNARPQEIIVPSVVIPLPSPNPQEASCSPIVQQSQTSAVRNRYQSNGKQLQRSGAYEDIRLAVFNCPFSCPFCTNQFDTAEELDQHQIASNHLFDCLICKRRFHSEIDLKDHQKAKKHASFKKHSTWKTIQLLFAPQD